MLTLLDNPICLLVTVWFHLGVKAQLRLTVRKATTAHGSLVKPRPAQATGTAPLSTELGITSKASGRLNREPSSPAIKSWDKAQASGPRGTPNTALLLWPTQTTAGLAS